MASIDLKFGWNGSSFYMIYDNLDDAAGPTTSYLTANTWAGPVNRYTSENGSFYWTIHEHISGEEVQFNFQWNGSNDDINLKFLSNTHGLTDSEINAYNSNSSRPYAGYLSTSGNSLADQYGSDFHFWMRADTTFASNRTNTINVEAAPMALAETEVLTMSGGVEWWNGEPLSGIGAPWASRSAGGVDRSHRGLLPDFAHDGNWAYESDPIPATVAVRSFKGINWGNRTYTPNPVVCFTPDTLIRTPQGDRPIQDLKAGDDVYTLDNGIQKIRWIGKSAVTEDTMEQFPEKFAPVRIKAGTFGNTRDLLVSQQHRMLVRGGEFDFVEAALEKYSANEALIAAKALVDGENVFFDYSVKSTEYYHMLFAAHEILIAEGALTESFYPGEQGMSTLSNAARAELYEFFPELEWEEFDDTARTVIRPGQVRRARAVR